jgi:hypothetical protein
MGPTAKDWSDMTMRIAWLINGSVIRKIIGTDCGRLRPTNTEMLLPYSRISGTRLTLCSANEDS